MFGPFPRGDGQVNGGATIALYPVELDAAAPGPYEDNLSTKQPKPGLGVNAGPNLRRGGAGRVTAWESSRRRAMPRLILPR